MSECEEHTKFTICELCKFFDKDKLFFQLCVTCIHNPKYHCHFNRRIKEREQSDDLYQEDREADTYDPYKEREQ